MVCVAACCRQVLVVSADYKWNLRRLENGTEEYHSTMKEVRPSVLTCNIHVLYMYCTCTIDTCPQVNYYTLHENSNHVRLSAGYTV